MRGCDEAPRNERGEAWDADGFVARYERLGRTRDDVDQHADDEYHLATAGQVWTRLGWLWPRCPRRFVAPEFADPPSVAIAHQVLRIRRLVRMGVPSAADHLTAIGTELLVAADRLCTELERARAKEDAQQ